MATAREYLWIVQESALGTQVVSPVVGTSQFLIPLVESNSFGMVEDVELLPVAYGGGVDVVADVIPGKRTNAGTLTTLGYPALVAFLHNAAVTRINSGQTSPWTTTEPVADLASFTVWHVVKPRTGSAWVYQYPGCKVASLTGSVSRSDPKLKLSLEIQASKELPNAWDSSTAGTPPAAPTEAQYPRGVYTFAHTKGFVKWGGTAVTQYSSLQYKISNKLDAGFWEDDWLTTLSALGREATADVDALLKVSPDWRAVYQAVTSGAFELKFGNGTNTAKLDFCGKNHVSKVPFDLPLGKEFQQKISLMNKWDAAAASGAGGDVIVTNT